MSDVIVRVGETENAVVSINDEAENASIGIDEQGTIKGDDGFSPVLSVEDIDGGHRLIVIDAEHPDGFSVDIMDGEDGNDGVSPSVVVTNIPGGHRVTITDADHSSGQPFNVMDGVTFTPSVDSTGTISWTNDGNRQNPQPVNITGPQGAQGLPAISGIVNTPGDLPDAAEHWLENWLVKDATDIYGTEMALFSARAVSGDQKSWEYIGSIKGENGVTFYPNVNEYGVLSWTNDGEKENPQPRNITGKDGPGIKIFGTHNELPNAFYHPEIAAAIVCTGAPEPYYLYENTGFAWFGHGSLKGDRGDMPFWFGTRAEYNALSEIDPDVCYCIEEGT